MRLEPIPRPDQTFRVTARLITSSTILHLSADELEYAVNAEQTENPALEVTEQRVCLFCGTSIHGQTCANCGQFGQLTQATFSVNDTSPHDENLPEIQWGDYHHYDIDDYASRDSDDDEDLDPLASIAMNETLAEILLRQLETLISPEDAVIAEQVVGNLNERGYLEISVRELANYLEVQVDRVEYVLSQLQTLEPVGIGARNLRECLLIQLQALSEQETPHPLAFVLIDRYLDRLGHSQFAEIARELKVPESEVRQATLYIRSNLHPFPAHTYLATTRVSPSAVYMRPDVIIRKGETGFEVELIEDKRYSFRIGPGYATQPLELDNDEATDELRHYMRQHTERAKFFIECMQRRWSTLRRIAEFIIEYQREFLENGVRSLRALTRAEVAAQLNLDEGTVSRATANKNALLPTGRLMPLSDFFDGSLGVKDVLRELIASEDPKHRYSDEELARMLTTRGISMARRTVSKYREEMGIASSRER